MNVTQETQEKPEGWRHWHIHLPIGESAMQERFIMNEQIYIEVNELEFMLFIREVGCYDHLLLGILCKRFLIAGKLF